MKVLVVGAGLSGMVLATALKRCGIAVDLIELHMPGADPTSLIAASMKALAAPI